MAESSQQTTLYGPADDKGTSRFQVLGDGRRMYPIYVAGSLYDIGFPPHKISRGGINQVKNLVARGDSLYSYGGKSTALSGSPGSISLRLGTASASGNNALTSDSFLLYGFPFATRRLDAGLHAGLMVNGESFYRETDPTATQLGCSSETFTITGTIDTVTIGNATLLGNATTFTTCVLPVGTYATYTPSLNIPRVGDIIRVTQGANKYFHRIVAITDATHLNIYPAWGKQLDNATNNGATTAGPGAALAYAIHRTGFGSYSRIVSIYRDSAAPNDVFYNYHVGNHFSRALPGTIECYTRESSGSAASSHFMCPQNSAAADIKAQDIAYYKNFLLYGYGGAISWSVAGFPTSFTTGFGATDFPAINTTVVANEDQFISFEMLGDQLLAIFRKSIWEIQATGTSPGEFEFYRLPEPVGAWLGTAADPYGSAAIMHARPTVSARNSIFYMSHSGLMELSGRSSKKVSEPVHALISEYLQVPASVMWDPSLSMVIVTGLGGKTGYTYRQDDQTWAQFDATLDPTPARYIGPVYESGSGLDLGRYVDAAETLRCFDDQTGAPFGQANANPSWTYQSPVISMGDDYTSFPFAGFQLDGRFSTGITYSIYGATNPIDCSGLVNLRDTGTLGASANSTSSNRKIYGKKIDDPFICIVLSGVGVAVQMTAINIYTLGGGR